MHGANNREKIMACRTTLRPLVGLFCCLFLGRKCAEKSVDMQKSRLNFSLKSMSNYSHRTHTERNLENQQTPYFTRVCENVGGFYLGTIRQKWGYLFKPPLQKEKPLFYGTFRRIRVLLFCIFSLCFIACYSASTDTATDTDFKMNTRLVLFYDDAEFGFPRHIAEHLHIPLTYIGD